MSYRRHLVLLKLLPAIILFETEFTISKADVPPPRNAVQHWSFQPLSNPSLPPSRNSEWPTSTLDHFILAKLEQHQLTAAVTADKHTLIRRATFDLTGLPPTPDEILDENRWSISGVVDAWREERQSEIQEVAETVSSPKENDEILSEWATAPSANRGADQPPPEPVKSKSEPEVVAESEPDGF